MSGANPRVEEAAAKAARDHEEILSAVHRLEAALASPAPGRETPWKQRAGAALVGVIDSLNMHRGAQSARPTAKGGGRTTREPRSTTRRPEAHMRGSARARLGTRVGAA